MKRAFFIAVTLTCAVLPRGAAAEELAPGPAEESLPEGYVDRSGVVELVFWQSVNGLIAGTLLSTAATGGELNDECIEEESSESGCENAVARGSGIVLVGLAAGIATPLLLTRGREVQTSDAILVNRGAIIGAMHGYILPFAAGLQPFTDDPDEVEFEKGEARALAGLTFAGDLLGVGAGAYLAYRFNPSPGFVSFAGTLHTTAFIASMSIGASFTDELTQDNTRVISAISLAVADLAIGATYYFREYIDIDRNRVFWLDTGALVGWLGGAGVGTIIAGESERAVAIGGTLGMAAGIAVTYFATKELETWRNRVDLDAPRDEEARTFEFLPPSLSLEGQRGPNGRMARVLKLDLVQGVF